MAYGIVHIRTKKRIRTQSGELFRLYDYPYEAQKVIESILGNSPYVTIKKIGGN